jgi:hypothetical protein
MTHKFTKLALCSVAALFVAGQAYAHTGVRDIATEGASSYNGFTITHGCGGDNGQAYPVTGQAAVFPYGAQTVWRTADIVATSGPDKGFITTPGTVLSTGGNGGGIISSASLNLNVTGYASASSAFATSQELVDSSDIVRGLLWKNGAMEPNLNTITPFKISAPTIVDPCVTLQIRVGVINYCETGKNEANDLAGPYKAPKDAFERPIPLLKVVDPADPLYTDGFQHNVNGSPVYRDIRAGNGDNNRADWWFGAISGPTALYNDADLLQPTEKVKTDANGDPILDASGNPVKGPVVPYWTTITVVNKEACAGTPRVVTVEPTGAAFDAILSGNNTRPFTSGNSNF